MSFLSNTLSRVKPSPTIAMTAKAAELKAAGRDVLASQLANRILTRRKTSKTPPSPRLRRAKPNTQHRTAFPS